jgi:hypothetical protein
MGILSTAAVIAVIAIVVAGGLFVLLHKTTTSKLTAQGAEGLVVNDIKAQNPGANVSLINATNSTQAKNSWLITLSVVYNGSRPCPTVQIEQFDYPAFGLHSYNPNTYSSFNSGVCHVPPTQNQALPVTLPIKSAIVIATSYASGYNAITSYVNLYGYNNTHVSACLVPSTDCNGAAFGGNETNTWLVKYNASDATYSLYVTLDQSGTVLNSYSISS